ncbi:dimethylarginine dimethylaminohydrolase family protein [Apibacter sp. B2966]|uniref:dimethylarginine dimethylaminohydrolase family protein n=1 Tax=Apibacter sp. B2966 TaxID=2656761 RepID=UPI0014093997|nr:arginine deiminase-related protein [Apibacter sp. B2966]QII72504.1 amidinotransferase [Apibacter sp. B2966]
MQLNIKNETSKLKVVVLGQPCSMGKTPELNETYDAKSYENVKNNSYPIEEDVIHEMKEFKKALQKYDVTVLTPEILKDYNQVFARDVAFVIEDKIIISNMIADRAEELYAYKEIFKSIYFQNIYNLPKKAKVEGGDIIPHNDVVFCGAYEGKDFANIKTARTNQYAIDYLKDLFPNKTFINLPLKKDDKNPRNGILHLDCTFMPVGKDKAILYKGGFANEKDYHFLLDFFGTNNVFEVTDEELYYMNTNVFSISPEVVISENKFERLNNFMENEWNIKVEKVPYHEISKMGGLLRCSTLPLIRTNE